MTEFPSLLSIILTLNSFTLLFLIFNQNESSKDIVKTSNSQSTSSLSNPFEKITWIVVLIEFVCFVIQIKI